MSPTARPSSQWELVEGESLDKKIKQGPLKLDEALDIAQQTARGLEAAHDKGIHHRDIKPENLMVDAKGHVTVMDFGLAQLTQASRLTRTNETLGTTPYMSPEQAQGSGTDHRTDIWSFGVVLYEMITGRHPFRGDYEQAVVYSIINEEPEPLTALRTAVPMQLEDYVSKCLAKDPGRRYQNAPDLIVDLEALAEKLRGSKSKVIIGRAAPAVSADQTYEPPKRRMAWVALAAAAAIAAGSGWWIRGWMTADAPQAPRHTLTQLTFDGGLTYQPTISPDGKFIAYSSDRSGEGNLDLWVQQVGGGGSPIRLTSDPADDMEPDFSPDGQTIVFHSRREGGGVYLVPALGGQEKLIAPHGNGPRFSPTGSEIAYWVGSRTGISEANASPNSASSVMTVPVSGLSPVSRTEEFVLARSPVWLDDSSGLVIEGRRTRADTTDWWIVPLDGTPAHATGAYQMSRDFVNQTWQPRISTAQGAYVVFSLPESNSRSLWRRRLPGPGSRAPGPPERLTFGAEEHFGGDSAESGRLVFASLRRQIDLWSLPLNTKSGLLAGDIEQLTDDPASKGWPAISLNGETVAFVTERNGNRDVMTLDLKTRVRTTVAGSGMVELWPWINSTGSKIAYAVTEQDGWRFDLAQLDGGLTRTILGGGGRFDGLSPDEGLLLHRRSSGIVAFDIATGEEDVLISRNERSQLYQSKFSPDGRWILFMKRELETPSLSRLFVARIEGETPVPERDWVEVSVGESMFDKCRWAANGALIYYVSNMDGFSCIWAQRLDPDTKRPVGEPLAAYHSHDPRRSIFNVDLGSQEISVARDKIVFNMATVTGNAWMMDPVERPE